MKNTEKTARRRRSYLAILGFWILCLATLFVVGAVLQWFA